MPPYPHLESASLSLRGFASTTWQGTETLLLLQCSGRVLAFSRAWPYPETDAPVMTQIGPEGQGMALLPAIEDAGSLTHLSFIKMPRLSWIAVCIGRKIRLHDTGKEKLRQVRMAMLG